MLNIFLSLFLVLGNIDTAHKYTLEGDHEASTAIMTTISPNKENYAKYCFIKSVNAYALGNKEEATKWCKNLEDSFDQVPTRYRALAYGMLSDMQDWKRGDLGEIGRDMKQVRDRLQIGKGGQKTQEIQKEIVAKLDKMIKEQEDAKNKQNQKDQQAQGEQGGKQQPGQPQGGQDQNAQDSKIMGGSGKGAVDEKKLRQIAQNWGTLPPAKRAEVVNEITRDLPPKYKPMIEEYFKALNRMHHVK